MRRDRNPKLIYVKTFCRGCKNVKPFKVKKKLWVNMYCLKCYVCGTTIGYPSRFESWRDMFFKWRRK